MVLFRFSMAFSKQYSLVVFARVLLVYAIARTIIGRSSQLQMHI